MATIDAEDPVAVAAVAAIHAGDVAALRRLLVEQPELVTAHLGPAECEGDRGITRSLLHVATDWPGHFPNGAATVAALVEAGADVNARVAGWHTETPLHWAASSDDVAVLDALVEAGADLEAPGGVIADGTPLADAVAFGQWQTARRLVEHGAHVPFREAAALGLLDRVTARFAQDPAPSADEVTGALWYACHGRQQRVAEYLIERDGDVNWISTWDQHTPLDAAARSEAEELVGWLRSRGARSARELG